MRNATAKLKENKKFLEFLDSATNEQLNKELTRLKKFAEGMQKMGQGEQVKDMEAKIIMLGNEQRRRNKEKESFFSEKVD